MKKQQLLRAAIAGITLGASTASVSMAADKPEDVKCYGINGCGSHAKCSVSQADLDAVRELIGDKDYKARYGKSEAHSCGSHAKCGASSQILNWVPTSSGECHEKAGFIVQEVDGKKVAKKG